MRNTIPELERPDAPGTFIRSENEAFFCLAVTDDPLRFDTNKLDFRLTSNEPRPTKHHNKGIDHAICRIKRNDPELSL